MKKQHQEKTKVKQGTKNTQPWVSSPRGQQALQDVLAKAEALMAQLSAVHHVSIRAETGGVSRVRVHPTRKSMSTWEKLPAEVTIRAYEVYRFIYGAQLAEGMDERREGFSIRETIALLYARSFPKHEWRVRVFKALVDRSNR